MVTLSGCLQLTRVGILQIHSWASARYFLGRGLRARFAEAEQPPANATSSARSAFSAALLVKIIGSAFELGHTLS
jgi:hypothetical protein